MESTPPWSHIITDAYVAPVKTPDQRRFFCYSALNFLEINQWFLQKFALSGKKAAAAQIMQLSKDLIQ